MKKKKTCVFSCENTEYPIILQNNTCVKFCPKELYLFNSYCYLTCPEGSYKIEEKKICECNNLFYIDDYNNKNCLTSTTCKENENYSYLIKNKNQCVKSCSSDNYFKYSFNNICYSQCPKNTKKNKENKCECMYKFYIKNNELICLNENEKCPENYYFLLENSNQCFKTCPEDTFIFNNKCLQSCIKEKKPFEKECVCNFNYFYNNSFLNCLNENENCPEDFPYLNTAKNECLINCSFQNLLTFKKECVNECPENYYELNSNCIEKCPLKNYYKTKKKICEISDCLERDLNENINLIHENNYEEFYGKNNCNISNNNYKYFIAEIYDSNFVFPENDNSKSSLNTKQCETILKQNYNLPESEILTIFKVDYYYDNLPPQKRTSKFFTNPKNST